MAKPAVCAVAAALGAVLMGGTVKAREFNADTTCGEWTNAVMADYLFDGEAATNFAKRVLTAAELTHIQHGEPGLFSKAPPETATDIAIEAGSKCLEHPEVRAFTALGGVYERKRGEFLAPVKPAKKRRT